MVSDDAKSYAAAIRMLPVGTPAVSVVAGGTYSFEAFLRVINGGTACTKSAMFDQAVGAATFTTISWDSDGRYGAVGSAASTKSGSHSATSASSPILASAATTEWAVRIQGMFTVDASGYFDPYYAYSADPTTSYVVKAGSYLRVLQLS